MSHLARTELEHFARNGRWGTCCECPRDGHGRLLPELCKNTERQDHCLTVDGLFELVKDKDRIAAEYKAAQEASRRAREG